MKAKDLANLLLQNPDAEVVFTSLIEFKNEYKRVHIDVERCDTSARLDLVTLSGDEI